MATIGHGTDSNEERAGGGGAEPTGEPDSQDSAGGGRGAGLTVATVLGILLIGVPLIWAVVYLMQSSAAGLGSGFTLLVGVVLLACIGVGAMLVSGLFTT